MAGPAMIEGGGLGVFTPEDVGPIEVQTTNGVVDLVAEDEVEAAALAKGCWPISKGRYRTGPAPTSGCCARRSRRTGCASTTSAP